MRFPPSFLDEIKARLPVSEVVRRRVKLVRAGREWKRLSPFIRSTSSRMRGCIEGKELSVPGSEETLSCQQTKGPPFIFAA